MIHLVHDPIHWLRRKPVPAAAVPFDEDAHHAAVLTAIGFHNFKHTSAAPAAQETSMATAPVTSAPTSSTENAVERFIDKVKAFFVKAEPVASAVETAAVAAEPILALTPAGPEYSVAVNAIVGAQQLAAASLAAGVNLTGTQKAQIAVSAATPALNAILTSKGISTGTESIIATWIQNVFNILAGPIEQLVEKA